MDKFLEMKTFAAVVDGGSFVQAADALAMSKPAVSRHVAELEQRLGVRLLQRTTRKLSLTEEGRLFYGRCKTVLADVEVAEEEITAQSVAVKGLIKVNVPVSFGLLELAPLWPDFMAKYPEVELDITLADRIVDLVEEGYDLAVRIARLPNSTLVSRKLASTRLVLCASPGYLRRHGKPKHPSELTAHAVLSYSLLASGDQWSFEGPEGPVVVTVKPVLRTNSGDTCIAAARKHKGVVLQPSFMVNADLQSGALVELMPDYRAITFDIFAVYPTRQYVSPKVRALIDFLARALKNTP
ncbi:LysR family transcriptional regulator [Rhodoferax lacus]|uniref:LysR family transcriptional regulator n=1 Tax=Rhodoferax lacus TaxID=2184758 RepID=A0A3E1RAZ0_9BURK|nr:LysR family transcriptional regulator [Rhodoferax lacus]RFO95840.1 LysR family transcriptional regulator [Rhodoferax lacus]